VLDKHQFSKVDALMKLCGALEARIAEREEAQAKLLESVTTELAAQG